MTGIGPVAVRQPRVRNRGAVADAPERIRFTPTILPPYARRSKSLEVLLPILYLKGISNLAIAPAPSLRTSRCRGNARLINTNATIPLSV